MFAVISIFAVILLLSNGNSKTLENKLYYTNPNNQVAPPAPPPPQPQPQPASTFLSWPGLSGNIIRNLSGGRPINGGNTGGGGGSTGSCNPVNSQTDGLISRTNFEGDALIAHNYYRKLHHSPDLVIDPELTSSAQAYANDLAASGRFEHSEPAKNGQYGENLARFSYTVNGNKAVDHWYCEINNYDFNNPQIRVTDPQTGHFTAVVWKSTQKVGIAIASGNGWTVVVAHYSPAGNNIGLLRENVLPK